MTKSQNTKNEQQKDLCITSEQLTEQWKKGELPYGRYYVELAYNGNSIIMAEYWWDKTLTLDDHKYSREEVKRILAPVPSYEEWIGVKQQRDLENKLRHDSDNKNWQLRTENQQLKELLKECVEYVKKDYGDYLTYTQSAIYQEINQALGESK